MIDSKDIMKALRPRLRRLVDYTGDDGLLLLHEHTGCEFSTIGGWLAASEPLAQPLIKAWYLLDELGFDSPEMGELSELQRYLGRLFGLGVITMPDLTGLLKGVTAQTAVQVLRGQDPMKLKEKRDLPGLRETYGAALAAKIAELPQIQVDWEMQDPAPMRAETPPPAPAQSQAAEPVETSLPELPTKFTFTAIDPGNVPLATALAVKTLSPLLQALVDADPATRDLFRRLVGLPHDSTYAVVLEQLDALRTSTTFASYRRP